MSNVNQFFQTAIAHHRAGNLAQAEVGYRQILQLQPNHADAMHLLGLVAHQVGRHAQAAELIAKAVRIAPRNVSYLNNLGLCLRALGRLTEAIENYRKALRLAPNDPDLHNNLGNALRDIGKPEEAAACYRKALGLEPRNAVTHYHLGNVLQDMNRHEDAVASYRKALQLGPSDADALNNLGNSLRELGRTKEAVACYHQALQFAQNHPTIVPALGNTLFELGEYREAANAFQLAAQLSPNDAAAHYNLGNALRELGQADEAANSYRNAQKLNPADADIHNNLGNVLRELGRLDEAIACYREALRLDPHLHHARMHLLHQCQHICDWRDFDDSIVEIRRLVRDEPSAQISPFAFLALPGTTPAEQRRCAEQWVVNRYAGLIEPDKRLGFNFLHADKERLRIGYLSGDFRQHPLAYLAVELFELHDRSQFEIFAYSYGAVDDTPIRKRVVAAFDHFIDIRLLSHEEAAHRIHADNIDILVDLTGFTQSSRTGVMALRPAPVQVNYLGFPGTMGAPFVDYLISDAFITPPGQAANYSEKLALLPDTYQPNDRQRRIAETPTRSECGLPEQTFVFCCFNQNFKITPQLFDIWIILLAKIPHAVLWLLECNAWAKENLQREAQARGIAPERILFAPRMPMEQHLARHRCADLFLDTLPYNAHTTASDALWAGLPVLTCSGETFASRVAGSLLHAIGLPELVVSNLADYEAVALQLAHDPGKLASLREKLAHNRLTTPLFDSVGFTRHIEHLYRDMWHKYLL